MIIDRIELRRFRSYGEVTLSPHPLVNIFFGQNGSGKTNLLEAIHYCALGKSHRISQDLNTVMMGESGASCHLYLKEGSFRKEIEVRLQAGEESVKSVWIDQKRAGRLSEMMGFLRCVIFSPEDLSIIREGPSVRRRYLDMMISQINRPYFIALQRYQAALSQRNAILKQARLNGAAPDGMIEDFEASMAEQARNIMLQRMKVTEYIAEKGKEIYRQISGKEEENLGIRYHASVSWDGQEEFPMKKVLAENREDDLRQGTTGLGPHRDDLVLTLNGKNMKQFASQGQTRTAALSLKMAQLRLIEQRTGDQPVLLLDDVMSELDLQRRMNLLESIRGIQTFITCSDEGDLEEWQDHRTYEVYMENQRSGLRLVKEGPATEKESPEEPDFE